MSKYLLLMVFVFSVNRYNSFAQQNKFEYTVAKDGTGEYTSIQEAINNMRVYPLKTIKLFIKNGIYKEKIFIPAENTDIHIIGEDVNNTIIEFDDYAGKNGHTTFSSYTFKVSGNRFSAENISFVNSAGRVGQALAVYVDGNEAVFKNCKFIGNQDTLFAAGENCKQYFFQCYIEGKTDFIFGPSTAVFERCNIRAKSTSYITAANTKEGNKFGFVFLECTITADSTVKNLYLGRPWRQYAKTAFIRCELPKQISKQGWHNWNNTANERTADYSEYQNYGEGASTDGRVKWSRQLTQKQFKKISKKNILIDSPTKKSMVLWFERI